MSDIRVRRHTILSVVGARPNFMKVAPVHRALSAFDDVESLILHTGQHYDRMMSEVFFEDLGLPEPHVHLGVGSGSHAEQTAAVMLGFERQALTSPPDLVVVYGDVNSTLACTLVCAKLGIPVAHVEAGLRSFDRAMPEEINRILTDHAASLLFTSEPAGKRNLEREGIPGDMIVESGNVMIDSLVAFLAREGITERRVRSGRPLILVTLHRPSNVDVPSRLATLAGLLKALGGESDVLFPVHPRTRARLEASGFSEELARSITFSEPLGYSSFMRLLTEASLVVTDSGGIQEEAAYIGVPSLTLRQSTERPITVDAGTNILEADCDGDIVGTARGLLAKRFPPIGRNPVLQAARWDGHAGERIAEALRTRAYAERHSDER